METYANVPGLLNGATWYAQWGTAMSKGTKVFALAGCVQNTGLVEVPVGTSLGELIYDIGGGLRGGKAYKAAQIGGPSGGCIPKENLNVPLDYESLQELGAIMGSGGLIVMDEDACMVDVARFFIEFVQEESCGKCAPCRVGTKRMGEILQRICEGKGELADLDRLEQLGRFIQEARCAGWGRPRRIRCFPRCGTSARNMCSISAINIAWRGVPGTGAGAVPGAPRPACMCRALCAGGRAATPRPSSCTANAIRLPRSARGCVSTPAKTIAAAARWMKLWPFAASSASWWIRNDHRETGSPPKRSQRRAQGGHCGRATAG